MFRGNTWRQVTFWLIAWALTAVPLLSAAEVETSRPVLQVFVREGCPHCARAKQYLPELQAKYQDLDIQLRYVDRDDEARLELERYSRMAGIWPPGVPSFVSRGRLYVGFDSPQISGPFIEWLIDKRINTETTIELPFWGKVSVDTFLSRLGLPLFTIAIGLIDGFNPCAMWVLLFLLSLLVHLQSRRRMALIAGTFVAVSGLIYFLFMAAWLNLFQWIGLSELLRWSLAAIALLIGAINMREFLLQRESFVLAIPSHVKPSLYAQMREVVRSRTLMPALIGVSVLALLVNMVELLCTAGFPAIYTAVLTQQGMSPASYYSYLGLYIVAYIADDALMVTLAVTALSSQKLTAGAGRWLKLASGLVMAGLGLIMLFSPQWLM